MLTSHRQWKGRWLQRIMMLLPVLPQKSDYCHNLTGWSVSHSEQDRTPFPDMQHVFKKKSEQNILTLRCKQAQALTLESAHWSAGAVRCLMFRHVFVFLLWESVELLPASVSVFAVIANRQMVERVIVKHRQRCCCALVCMTHHCHSDLYLFPSTSFVPPPLLHL